MEFSFISYLQLDVGEEFPALHPATTALQGTLQISLEVVHPIRWGKRSRADRLGFA